MLRMVLPLRFRLLFPERKDVCVYFPLRLGLWLSEWKAILGGRLAKLIGLWFMMRFGVASLIKDMLTRNISVHSMSSNSLRYQRMMPRLPSRFGERPELGTLVMSGVLHYHNG